MSAHVAVVIASPLYTDSDHRVDLVAWQTEERKNREDITGIVITLLIEDPVGTVRSYTATHDTDSEGEAHFTLTGANHTAAREAIEAQVQFDGIPKADFELEVKAKKTAT